MPEPPAGIPFAQTAYYVIGDADIEVHDGELLMGDWVTPCGSPASLISRLLPLPEAVQLRDGRLDYQDETITLTKVPVSRQVTDGTGRVILCGPSIIEAQP